ncbi:arylsulfatase [uncultured Phycicoccus sp.]|uniref:arylsulfatase n=1 Tax=uncultured Phycicoccus sp. TaxID=661422 RepID=UPI0026180A77|nr:arylsulfatase [uncultured Phycicoccus sp.]
MTGQPDILLVLVDDMGFSDIGCFGGEISTPTLDRLGRDGVRFTQFYNSPRCSPSRASLLTGLHPHQVGVGILNFDDTPDGYPGNLSEDCVTVAECLRDAGYATHLSGKWHLASDMETPNPAWPTRRGFDHVYGTLEGAGSFYNPRTLHRGEDDIAAEAAASGYYYTDAISEEACGFVDEHVAQRADQPFFCYLAYTAPHWPLHAHEDDVAAYRGRFDAGWDELRQHRLGRLVDEGILRADWPLTDRDPRVPAWADAADHEWEARRMEVYAAQVTAMDRGLGQVLDRLEAAGRLENTIVVFLSDNGGCAEELDRAFVEAFVPLADTTKDGREVVAGNVPGVMPGDEATYASYGRAWANLSNTPFREYKHWVHEGGIATPLLVHWPAGVQAPGRLEHQPLQLVDVLPSLLEAAGARYPQQRQGRPIPPAEGRSFLPTVRSGEPVPERPLFWEHEGNAGVRQGRWKLVRKWGGPWELYDMAVDRTELDDRAGGDPERVAAMAAEYESWAARCGVIPRQVVLDLYARRGAGLPPE